jgi:hypothetical protein
MTNDNEKSKKPTPTESNTTISPTVETVEETTTPLISEPVLYTEVGYEPPMSYWGAVDHRDALQYYIELLEVECNSENYTADAVDSMRKEIDRLKADQLKLDEDINKFKRWDEEHYYASQVWQYFRTRGFSPEVVAGIIGNMMIETSGGTLNLKPTVYNPSRGYYGLCQWSLYYKPYMADTSFEYQLEFLENDMPVEFKNFGFCYYKGFTYDEFLAMESPEEAAIAFAKVYERCASGSYGIRKVAARDAYNYFMG